MGVDDNVSQGQVPVLPCSLLWGDGMREIDYADISKTVKKAVRPYITKWEHILPDWCRVLRVREWEEDDSSLLAAFHSSPNYREAILFIYPKLLARPDIELTIVHEFCHAYTSLAPQCFRDYINDVDMAKSTSDTLKRRVSDFEEQATCDLQDLIMRLSRGHK